MSVHDCVTPMDHGDISWKVPSKRLATEVDQDMAYWDNELLATATSDAPIEGSEGIDDESYSAARYYRNLAVGRWLSSNEINEKIDLSAQKCLFTEDESQHAVLPPPKRYRRRRNKDPSFFDAATISVM